nr:DUF3265 domain-containing protein [Vibrio parahaemolyticus]
MRPTEQYKGYKSYEHNKQFKRYLARVAFWVCVGFGVEVLCGNIGIACFTP